MGVEWCFEEFLKRGEMIDHPPGTRNDNPQVQNGGRQPMQFIQEPGVQQPSQSSSSRLLSSGSSSIVYFRVTWQFCRCFVLLADLFRLI